MKRSWTLHLVSETTERFEPSPVGTIEVRVPYSLKNEL